MKVKQIVILVSVISSSLIHSMEYLGSGKQCGSYDQAFLNNRMQFVNQELERLRIAEQALNAEIKNKIIKNKRIDNQRIENQIIDMYLSYGFIGRLKDKNCIALYNELFPGQTNGMPNSINSGIYDSVSVVEKNDNFTVIAKQEGYKKADNSATTNFQCEYNGCGRPYKYKSSLERHIREKHTNN